MPELDPATVTAADGRDLLAAASADPDLSFFPTRRVSRS